MGRRTELNDITAQKIINCVKTGQTMATAARLANISESTLYGWLARGRNGDPKYLEFLEKFEHAEADFEERTVKLAYTLAEKDYKYLMDFLSRRFPQSWGTLARQPQAITAGVNSDLDAASEDDVIKALEGKGWKRTGTNE